jgi:hypothetical protein
MIKGLASLGKYTVVQSGNATMPYVNPNANNPMTGMLRINGTDVEVFNGSSWMLVNSSYASMGLSLEAEELLDWAKAKRAEEQQLDELCKKYPGLGKARDNYETFKRLVESEAQI